MSPNLHQTFIELSRGFCIVNADKNMAGRSQLAFGKFNELKLTQH